MTETASLLRRAVRSLARSPRFTFGVLGVLALGLGATTAVFTLVDAALFRPLPFPDAERVVRVFGANEEGDDMQSVSGPYFAVLRDGADSLSSLAAYAEGNSLELSLPEGGAPERIVGTLVTGDYFRVLGLPPALGRWIGPEDDGALGSGPVVVLADGFWRRAFGADPSVVGREVRINRHPFTVVGVAPPGLVGASLDSAPDVWLPSSMVTEAIPFLGRISGGGDPRDMRHLSWLMTVGRLAPGATPEAADAEMTALAARFIAEDPSADRNPTVEVVRASAALFDPGGGTESVAARVERLTLLLGGVVTLLFLLSAAVACSLLLVRTERRRRDVAVRLSLGAGRGRLAREIAAEGVLLGLASGALALGVATLVQEALLAVLPERFPLGAAVVTPVTDPRMILFALLAAAVAGALLAGLPVARLVGAGGSHLDAPLRGASGGLGTRRWMPLRNGLVVAQVALSVVVLTGAGLLLRTLWSTARVDPGFPAGGALVAELDLSLAGYDQEEGARFQRQVVERLAAVPGVASAAMASHVPVSSRASRTSVRPEGVEVSEDDPPHLHMNTVGPGYFEALGVPVLRGRGFEASDDVDGPPVAIVNRAFVERFWPDRDPIGLRIDGASRDREREPEGPIVVGVVADHRTTSLREDPQPAVYRPLQQFYMERASALVRLSGDSASASTVEERALPIVTRVLRDLDPDLPLVRARSLEAHVGATLAQERALAILLAAFGALTVLLSLGGLYSVLAYVTETRTREFGIRMAVGADRARVAALVVRQGVALAALGLVAGLLVALVAGGLLEGLLFGVGPEDPWTLAAVGALTLLAGAAGAWAPARSATKVDPMETLRSE